MHNFVLYNMRKVNEKVFSGNYQTKIFIILNLFSKIRHDIIKIDFIENLICNIPWLKLINLVIFLSLKTEHIFPLLVKIKGSDNYGDKKI